MFLLFSISDVVHISVNEVVFQNENIIFPLNLP